MKIEFVTDGAQDCPLIRLFDFKPEIEVKALCDACLDLADGRITEYALHNQPWIEAVADCRFVWRVHPKNIGVRLPRSGGDFELLYNREGWLEVEGKLQAFRGEWTFGGFNWLTNEGDINVLFSHSGLW